MVKGVKMKRLAILMALVVVVLFALCCCLAKYLDAELGFAVNGNDLTVRVANIPHLTASEYLFNIKNICLIGFLVLLVFWRSLLLRLAWK